MNTAVFSTASETYQVANICYAGPVSEIPSDRRKGESTHSFRMITSMGRVTCYFKSADSAKKAHGLLGAMMEQSKPAVFKHGYDVIDLRRVVSFSKALALKSVNSGHTHAVAVTLDCLGGEGTQVWLRYRSEENAQKGRKALYAAISALNREVAAELEETPAGESETAALMAA